MTQPLQIMFVLPVTSGHLSKATKFHGNMLHWTWNIIIATDCSEPTWRWGICGHIYTCIHRTHMTMVKWQYNESLNSNPLWFGRGGYCFWVKNKQLWMPSICLKFILAKGFLITMAYTLYHVYNVSMFKWIFGIIVLYLYFSKTIPVTPFSRMVPTVYLTLATCGRWRRPSGVTDWSLGSPPTLRSQGWVPTLRSQAPWPHRVLGKQLYPCGVVY